MIIEIPIFILSLVFILIAANYLTNVAVNIAIFFNFSAFFISSILIGIGTSLPEFIVSIIAAINSKPEISISNVVGSNIFNIFGIASLTFFIAKKIDIAKLDYAIFNISALMAVLMVAFISTYNLFYLAITFLIFTFFIVQSYKNHKTEEKYPQEKSKKHIALYLLLAIVWLFVIIVASNAFLYSLDKILLSYHVSPKLIGTFIIAIGTSLPEIATCTVSIIKKRFDVAFGNILGSNIFNILMVLNFSRYFIDQISTNYTLDLFILLLFTVALSLRIFFYKIAKHFYIFLFLPVYGFYLWSLF